MNVFSIFALGFLFKNCSCFQCYCQGQNGWEQINCKLQKAIFFSVFSDNCVNGFCETENYCIKSWIVANGAVSNQVFFFWNSRVYKENFKDCLNTRTDLSDRQCQKNRRGLVSCICEWFFKKYFSSYLEFRMKPNWLKKISIRGAIWTWKNSIFNFFKELLQLKNY